MSNDLIGTTEAARILGISPRQAARLAENGEVPAFKVSQSWLMQRRDVLDLKVQRDREAKSRENPG